MIEEEVAKLNLWQHYADEYDYEQLEECWANIGEPMQDIYLRRAAQILYLFSPQYNFPAYTGRTKAREYIGCPTCKGIGSLLHPERLVVLPPDSAILKGISNLANIGDSQFE